MIRVEKDFTSVPLTLKSLNREESFDLNIVAKSFDNGKTLYKPDDVKEELHKIYNIKCAYCEKDITDEPKHVEHYRPKDIYYWLAYSWDNLFLCCGRCNSSKGKRFETLKPQVTYNNEKFIDIHNLGDSYDKLEEPMIINPEKEDILNDIIFNRDAEMSSNNKRVQHTIEKACKLNNPSLLQSRIKVVNKFITSINKHYYLYKKDSSAKMDRFEPDVETLIKDCKKENDFYSFRYFVLNNIELYFENAEIQDILKDLIVKLGKF